MAMDFDRYLLVTDLDSEYHVIQSAYRDWSSYCYVGFCSGSSLDRSERPSLASAARWPQTAPIGISSRICDPLPAENGPEWMDGDHVTRGRQTGSDRSDMNDTSNMTGPITCQNSDRKCSDHVISSQRGPVLGLSGLRRHGAKNGLPVSRRLATETFPKCATWCSTKTRMTSSPDRNGIGRYPVIALRENEIDNHVFASKRTTIVTSSRLLLTSISDVIEECSSSEDDSSSESKQTPEVTQTRHRKVSFADERGRDLVTCRVFEREQSPIDFRVTMTSLTDDDDDEDDTTEDDDDDLEDVDTKTDITSRADGNRKFSLLAEDAYKHLNRDIDNLKRLIEKHRRFFDSLRPSDDVTNGDKSNRPPECSTKHEQDADSANISHTIEGLEAVISNGDWSDRPEVVLRNGDDAKNTALPMATERDDDFRCRFVNFDLDNVADTGKGNVVTLTELRADDVSRHIVGSIRVQRSDADGVLFVRYTTDDWRTRHDVIGSRASSSSLSSSSNCDVFRFRIAFDASHVTLSQVAMEFAVCYRTAEGSAEFWDNNGGKNYLLDIYL